MKKRTVLLVLVLSIVAATQQGFFWGDKSEKKADSYTKDTVVETSKPAQKVELAPDFTLPNQNGESISLSQFKGKVVVLEWTNHQCPYVKKHYNSNNMQGLQAKYAREGVVWLSIISSAPGKQGHVSGEEAARIMDEKGSVALHVLLDETGEVGRQYNAVTTPHMYVINESGKLVYQGAIDDNSSANPKVIPDSKNYVSAALDALLAGKTVSISKTKPYGCSVKY
jgi:peroxiredoxin